MDKQLEQILQRLGALEERVAILEGLPQIKLDSVLETEDLVLKIANKIGDCDENVLLEKKVIDGENMEAKVLLGFYISYKYFKNAWLTSGDVERITSHLGMKVKTSNASTKLKKLHRYLESEKVRKNGSATPYRLNRAGVKHFEEILNGN